MSIESGWCGLLCLAAAAAPAKYFGPTRPADSRSRPDQQPTRHQSAVALRPVTDAGRRGEQHQHVQEILKRDIGRYLSDQSDVE